jgi:hypothetical protein
VSAQKGAGTGPGEAALQDNLIKKVQMAKRNPDESNLLFPKKILADQIHRVIPAACIWFDWIMSRTKLMVCTTRQSHNAMSNPLSPLHLYMLLTRTMLKGRTVLTRKLDSATAWRSKNSDTYT